MKKRILVFLAAVIAVITLFGTACFGQGGEDSGTRYDVLKQMLNGDYTALKFTATMESGGVTLENTFDIRYKGIKTVIDYSVQRLSRLSLDSAPDMIETLSGSVTVQDGAIVEMSGEAVSIPFEKLTSLGLDFSDNYFADAVLTETSFYAKVLDPKSFLGVSEFSGSGMEVEAVFTDQCQKIVITYAADLSTSVRYCYQFVI